MDAARTNSASGCGVDGWLDYEGEDAVVVEACAEDARSEVELPDGFAWALSVAHDVDVASYVDDNRMTQFSIEGKLLFDGGDTATYRWTCTATKYLNIVRVHEAAIELAK